MKGDTVRALRFALPMMLAALACLAAAGEIRPYSQTQFDSLATSGKPVLLAVRASWCTTCMAQKPILDALMAQPAYKDVTLLTIDFDADKPLLSRYKVGMQSTLIAFRGANEVGRTVGDTTPAGIEALVRMTVN